jgi:hypothetical protein
MKFRQTVIETRTYEVEYVVEAKNVEEAEQKIAIGETLEENEIKTCDVLQRDPWNEPEKIVTPKPGKARIFDVHVCRTGYGHATLRVKATTPEQARNLAMENAGDYSYSEKESDYSAEGVSESADQNSAPEIGLGLD